ncbi:class I SAM-dependent methyltransferase [Candidatus Micrarchaeota archaeon]|nr:class I SAM-dependent methyltransferase [Candidatus Micrarchaeota archaeon]
MLLREHRERWICQKAAEYRVRGRVLDVGAKDARHGKLFSGCAYEALDAEPKSGNVRKGDAHRLPYERDTFDCVLLIEVLEHVDDPLLVLGECSRVLKRNGVMFFSTPYLAMPAHGDYWRFSVEGLRIMFKKAGLRIRSEEKFGGITSIFATWLETIATARKWGVMVKPFAALAGAASRAEKPGMSYCESFYVLTKL